MDDNELNNLFSDNNNKEMHDKQSDDIVQKNVTKDIELTKEQKILILKAWENDKIPSIEELCKLCYPSEQIDGRSLKGRKIKEYLISQNLQAKSKTTYDKKGFIELSPEFKEYIKNNPNEKPREIGRILFNNPNLAATSQEVRSILAYQKQLEQEGEYKREFVEEDTTEEYRPPKTFDHCVARINKYVRESNLDPKTLSAANKKCCKTLIDYLHSYTFNHQANSYSSPDSRDLFESVFISYCYDKPDLSREEVDKMIMIATEKVIASNKLREIEMLQEEQQRERDEKGKMSMTIVEMINVQTTEYNSSIKRQQSLYNDLTEKRSERLKGKLKETASVLNLIELWKNEETRNKMIKIANERKEKVKEEIDRLSNMDDLIGVIAGLDKNEILNN